MNTCNNPNCTITNGKCDSQHRCFKCKAFIHMLCGVEYYDDAGDVVENLSFPRICYPCDEKGQVGKQRRGKGRKSKSNDGISSPKTASAAGIDSGSPKSPSTDLSNDKTITRSSGRRQQSTQKPSPRSKKQTSKKVNQILIDDEPKKVL